jgi:hypothetical protein
MPDELAVVTTYLEGPVDERPHSTACAAYCCMQ